MADNLTAFTDALSSTTNRTVDGFGEIIQEISPARGAITSWYDGGGNLTKTVDADSIETDFTYDAANRRTAMSAPGAISAAYAYDATTGGNFGIGRLTSASVASDSVAYVYDAQGRVIGDSKVIADSGYGTAFNVTYAYDANGKVIAVHTITEIPPSPKSILFSLVEEEASVDEIVARGHERDTAERVQRLLYASEYKRRQSAPGVKIGGKAFGRDRRYPLVNRFRDRVSD